jgi:dynactin complex subunit
MDLADFPYIFYQKNLKKLPKIRAIPTHLSALRSSLNINIWRNYREKTILKVWT